MMYIQRLIPLQQTLKTKSVLLLGPRRTGKSALLKHQLKADVQIDLLQADDFQALSFRPSSLGERIRSSDKLVVIDEIQKLPLLLDEVHSLIERKGIRFVLTGSSARKLRREHTSLMAGRARRLYLHPFCYPEIQNNFSLERALSLGTLPPVHTQEDEKEAWLELKDYSGDYLRDEILAEAIVRKVDSFSRFLHVAARMNGELLNFEAIGSDAQVPGRTVREYFSVLQDTLVGRQLEPHRFKNKKSRKSIATGKFYFFDCGVLNALLGRKQISADSPEFGNLFETWIFLELQAYQHYQGPGEDCLIEFWRDPAGNEVDFLLNEEIAIEVKATRSVQPRHLDGLRKLSALTKLKRKIVVSRDPVPRFVEDIEILPWKQFVEILWAGELF
jgi:predicted AAA+ superfamily ATPase